ncbi:unnamed protein product [Closterium sp. NIES-54]
MAVLAHLHGGMAVKVVHRDVKASNVLLDAQWNAKLGDFALAKAMGRDQGHVGTRVMGTFGYVAPEYMNTGLLTERSDVYSFGVLLLELISGRPPIDNEAPSDQVDLVRWVRAKAAEERLLEVLDPRLQGTVQADDVEYALGVALRCVEPNALKRPKMPQIVHMLESEDPKKGPHIITLSSYTDPSSSSHHFLHPASLFLNSNPSSSRPSHFLNPLSSSLALPPSPSPPSEGRLGGEEAQPIQCALPRLRPLPPRLLPPLRLLPPHTPPARLLPPHRHPRALPPRPLLPRPQPPRVPCCCLCSRKVWIGGAGSLSQNSAYYGMPGSARAPEAYRASSSSPRQYGMPGSARAAEPYRTSSSPRIGGSPSVNNSYYPSRNAASPTAPDIGAMIASAAMRTSSPRALHFQGSSGSSPRAMSPRGYSPRAFGPPGGMTGGSPGVGMMGMSPRVASPRPSSPRMQNGGDAGSVIRLIRVAELAAVLHNVALISPAAPTVPRPPPAPHFHCPSAHRCTSLLFRPSLQRVIGVTKLVAVLQYVSLVPPAAPAGP